MPEEFRIAILPDQHCLEAEGIKYSYDLFRGLGMSGFPGGVFFQIVKGEDGMLTVTRYNFEEAASEWARDNGWKEPD